MANETHNPALHRRHSLSVLLRDAMASQDQQRQTMLIAKIDTLEHNNGRVIEKFSQLD